MSPKPLLLALCASLAAPALAQADPAPQTFAPLFTSWGGVTRDSLQAEARIARTPAPAGAVPAMADQSRSQAEAEALGERVAEAVRAGDCAEGERIAREAGDFPLVAAVRDYCRSRAPS